MGFHKRYIDAKQVCYRYSHYGMEEVLKWIRSADAIICTDDFTMKLTDLLDSEGDETEIWNKASEMIAMKSLEMEKVS
jgi:hypothetical protein